MSLASNLQNLATRIATEAKALRTLINGNTADLSALTTSAKSNLVAAINELQGEINALSSGAVISDGSTSTSSTWSSTKIVEQLDAYKASILGGASSAYDTLVELQAFIEEHEGDLTGLLTAVGNRVRFDAAQTLTSPQQAQARTNIGAVSASDMGDPATNFVTTFEAGLT